MTKGVKKITVVVMAITMLIGTFALNGCNNGSLDKYKAIKKTELQNYVQESEYFTENWTTVCSFVSAGIMAIDEAHSKPAVDTAVKDTKSAIKEVQKLVLEKKFFWNGSIIDIADNETILIIIDKSFNAKEFTSDDFKMVEIVDESFAWLTKTAYEKHIETQSLPEEFRHIIIFKIIDKGSQNLIDAIRKLEAINFVKSASPNSIDSPDK